VTGDVILRESGDLLRFATLDDAAREMEPIDVRNGEWTAWDVTGRVLEPTVERTRRGRGIFAITVEHVVLRPTDARDPEGLADTIHQWLLALGTDAPRPATLEQALAMWDRLG
jgi:hypothetical protein